MRDEAEKRIGTLYPKATLPDGMRRRSSPGSGRAPSRVPTRPAGSRCRSCDPGGSARRRARRHGSAVIVADRSSERQASRASRSATASGRTDSGHDGTVERNGATCIACGAAVELEYIRSRGRAGRHGRSSSWPWLPRQSQRIYLQPTRSMKPRPTSQRPADVPDGEPARRGPRIPSPDTTA